MSLLSQLALLAILIKVKKTGILLVFIHPVAVSVSSLYCWLGPGEEVCRCLSTELCQLAPCSVTRGHVDSGAGTFLMHSL